MKPRPTLACLSSIAVAATTLVALAPSASAEDDKGRGVAPEANAAAPSTAPSAKVAARLPDFGDDIEMPAEYPYEPKLRIYPDNNPDASDTGELLGHDDLAPELMDLMETSNRLSVQVVGQSTAGRDLYLATVTAPEGISETSQQSAWRDQIEEDPEAAADDDALASGYKTPIWISNNIHGNEWEGTDAAMRTITDLVEAPWQEVKNLLRDNRFYFSLTLNPDGRTLGTRATSLNLDANRDMITNATPETLSFIKTAQAVQPLYAADFHGYTGVLQVEPCGPPHGENYEYDLFIPHAYAMARQVEDDVVAADIPGNTYYNIDTGAVVPENTGPETAHIKIPYRDTPSGWDDYPPIFTAQYAAYFGAATSTVELPKSRPNGSSQSPASATVNVAVAEQTMSTMLEYFDANSGELLDNQIEAFRRGLAGEPKDSLTTDEVAAVPGPTEWQPLWDVVDDQDPVTLPRAYVIPTGAGQRSASDARRLVAQLLLHDIEVGELDAATSVGGTTYPAGSYVVDMHQPMRGLANSLLDLGTDISQKVPSMYDISAWSYSYTWGATVDKVGLTADEPLGAVTPVTEPSSNAAIPADGGHLTFDLAGVADFQALNALLEADVPVSMLEDGSAVIGPESYADAQQVSEDFDIAFSAASAEDLASLEDEATRDLSDLTVAYTGTQDDKLSLTELGFDDLLPITSAGVNADPAVIEQADILWIGGSFNLTPGSPARTAVQAWVDEGHSIVGRTNQAFSVASTYGLVSGTAVSGNSAGNGIVAVDTPTESMLAPYEQDSAFIYPAYWFTGLGAGTRAEQSYDATSPLLAGHWRDGTTNTTNGPDDAAGNPSVVSGEAASGARAVVFGTSVFFRNHPKGGLSQAARALFWAGTEGEDVEAPSSTTVDVTAPDPVAYPGDPSVTVTVTADEGTPTGSVELLDGEQVVGSGVLVDGETTIELEDLQPGRLSLVASYAPAGSGFEPATSEPFRVRVTKAPSTTDLAVQKLGNQRVRATVTLTVADLPPSGTVVIRNASRVLRTIEVGGRTGVRTVMFTLPKGRHELRAVRLGSRLVQRSVSDVVPVRIGG